MTHGNSDEDVPELSIIVPVLNEAKLLPTFVGAVTTELRSAGINSFEIVVVDDGSSDDTWHVATDLGRDAPVTAVRLTRNVGKEAALAAGLAQARGRAHVPMDVDLQDPPHLLPQMVDLWRSGSAVVLCRRRDRMESAPKRWTASMYYWIAAKGSHVDIPQQVGDFRLMDKDITHRFLSLPERNRFNKGLFALVAPKECAVVEFDRPAGRSGERPRQSWARLMSLGIDGLVSFSTWPLRLLSSLGFVMLALSIVGAVASVTMRALNILEVPGQTTVVLVGLFLGGFQALSIGILGEYIARILVEVKARPLFVVDAVAAPAGAPRATTDARVLDRDPQPSDFSPEGTPRAD